MENTILLLSRREQWPLATQREKQDDTGGPARTRAMFYAGNMLRNFWRRHDEPGSEPAANLTDDELELLRKTLEEHASQGNKRAHGAASPEPGTSEAESPKLPSPDALEPWGPRGAPPVGQWVEDPLGAPFEVYTLGLGEDEEGPVVASLVRNSDKGDQEEPKRFAILYLHGRNDYFFHREAAKALSEMGGAFYALDLRKYGRSLRPWQTIGYTDDLTVYDRELATAIGMIREDHPDVPLVIYGHSTGGLIATLFLWRNPEAASGLILNSAWLELQSMTAMRPALHQVVSRLAAVRPRATVVGASKNSSYYRSIAEGWGTSGLPLPTYFEGHEDDNAIIGWPVYPEWKLPHSYPAPAAWMQAVLEGHAQVEKHVHLRCPVLSMVSSASHPEEHWGEGFFSSDVVLNPSLVAARSVGLSNQVVIERFPDKHDLLLSDPPVRQDIYQAIKRWLVFAQIVVG